MMEGRSVKEWVRLPVLPVSLKVSAVSSTGPEQVTGPCPKSVGLVWMPCLPGGRSCKATWLRAWTHNSLRGGQSQSVRIIHSITGDRPGSESELCLRFLLTQILAMVCDPVQFPLFYLFSYPMAYSFIVCLFKACSVVGTGDQGR